MWRWQPVWRYSQAHDHGDGVHDRGGYRVHVLLKKLLKDYFCLTLPF